MERWQYNVELPARKNEKKEFPSGEKGAIFCLVCRSVYYKKSWHHALKQSLTRGKSSLKAKTYKLKTILCPACQMIKDKEFEGQLVIGGFPANLKSDLVQLIKNFCQRAFERDPMDRLINIKTDKSGLVVTVTENQLAVKLAKKIKEAFNKYKIRIKISYSPEPSDTAYIKLNFSE